MSKKSKTAIKYACRHVQKRQKVFDMYAIVYHGDESGGNKRFRLHLISVVYANLGDVLRLCNVWHDIWMPTNKLPALRITYYSTHNSTPLISFYSFSIVVGSMSRLSERSYASAPLPAARSPLFSLHYLCAVFCRLRSFDSSNISACWSWTGKQGLQSPMFC